MINYDKLLMSLGSFRVATLPGNLEKRGVFNTFYMFISKIS